MTPILTRLTPFKYTINTSITLPNSNTTIHGPFGTYHKLTTIASPSPSSPLSNTLMKCQTLKRRTRKLYIRSNFPNIFYSISTHPISPHPITWQGHPPPPPPHPIHPRIPTSRNNLHHPPHTLLTLPK